MFNKRRPPPNSYVWIAAHQVPIVTADFVGEIDTVTFRHDSLRLSQGGGTLLAVESYETTLCVGALVCRWVGTTLLDPIMLRSPGPSFGQILPQTIRNLSWPPGVLSDEDLKHVLAAGDERNPTPEVEPDAP